MDTAASTAGRLGPVLPRQRDHHGRVARGVVEAEGKTHHEQRSTDLDLVEGTIQVAGREGAIKRHLGQRGAFEIGHRNAGLDAIGEVLARLVARNRRLSRSMNKPLALVGSLFEGGGPRGGG